MVDKYYSIGKAVKPKVVEPSISSAIKSSSASNHISFLSLSPHARAPISASIPLCCQLDYKTSFKWRMREEEEVEAKKKMVPETDLPD
jgi:hypothetical protein